MHIDGWFMGVGVAALIVACFSIPLLGAQGPALTVGQGILALSVPVFLVCLGGWIVTNIRENRAERRIGHPEITTLMEKERWDDAIAKLEVLQTSSDGETRVEAWNLLAGCYAATGKNAEAEAMIQRSIEALGEANENLGEHLACLGAVVRRQGRTEEAGEIYARALDRLHQDPEGTVFTLRNVAYLYWVTGDHDRAVEIYAEMPECDANQLESLTEILKPFAEPPLPAESG